MVSKASDDLPEPDTPVTTVKVLCGISKSMFLRLWTRAPRTTMVSVDIRESVLPLPQTCDSWSHRHTGTCRGYAESCIIKQEGCRKLFPTLGGDAELDPSTLGFQYSGR